MLFPNPSNGIVTVQFESEGRKEMNVYNETGQLILTRATENYSENIDLTRYAKGIYLVRVNSNSVPVWFRVILQ